MLLTIRTKKGTQTLLVLYIVNYEIIRKRSGWKASAGASSCGTQVLRFTITSFPFLSQTAKQIRRPGQAFLKLFNSQSETLGDLF